MDKPKLDKPKLDKPKFSQLTLAALLGATSAIAIIAGTIAIFLPGDAAIRQERGSGRNPRIIISNEETEDKKQRQKTEIAASNGEEQSGEEQTTEKGPKEPDTVGDPRRD